MIARWFWREWRSPSLLIVWLALSLAVACVLALGSISDRMEKGSASRAANLWPATGRCAARARCRRWIDEARKLGLTVGEQLSFATMTFAGDTPQLADVKAVDDSYPLYGTWRRSRRG
jgi:putative ABC transport system permease protein